MKKCMIVGIFFIVLCVLAGSLCVNSAEAINHQVKITNTTNLICHVWFWYGMKDIWGDRNVKEHQFYYNQPNASVTFETGAKCPVELQIACDGGLNQYMCMDGRTVSGPDKCPLSCWGSDWFIRDDGQGGAKVTRE